MYSTCIISYNQANGYKGALQYVGQAIFSAN